MTRTAVPRRHSLLARFAVAHALVAVLVVGLVSALFVHANNVFMHHIMYRQVRGYSQAVFDLAAASDDPAVWSRLAAEHGADLIVHTRDASFGFDAEGAASEPEALRAGADLGRWFVVTREDRLGGAPPDLAALELAEPSVRSIEVAWRRRLGTMAQVHVFASYGILLLGVIGAAHWYFRSQLRPLRALRDGVEAVARGDFTSEVPVVRPDEIGQFTEAFNDMTRRVARMLADREQLLADVSHELRSPLARVKVALELVADEGDANRRSIQNDVREMESLITVLLERARLASTEDGARFAEVDLARLVRRVVGVVAHRPPGVVLDIESAGAWPVRGDAALLRLLVHNLLDNALKFSRRDSEPVRLCLRAGAENAAVVLEVIDDGIGLGGLDGAEVERVFEPFVKLDRARGHHSGFGLGLDLCRRIVSVHGGSIELEARAEGGSRAQVVLPR